MHPLSMERFRSIDILAVDQAVHMHALADKRILMVYYADLTARRGAAWDGNCI